MLIPMYTPLWVYEGNTGGASARDQPLAILEDPGLISPYLQLGVEAEAEVYRLTHIPPTNFFHANVNGLS